MSNVNNKSRKTRRQRKSKQPPKQRHYMPLMGKLLTQALTEGNGDAGKYSSIYAAKEQPLQKTIEAGKVEETREKAMKGLWIRGVLFALCMVGIAYASYAQWFME